MYIIDQGQDKCYLAVSHHVSSVMTKAVIKIPMCRRIIVTISVVYTYTYIHIHIEVHHVVPNATCTIENEGVKYQQMFSKSNQNKL